MRQLTRSEIEEATKAHNEIESIVIHATGMIITPLQGDEFVEVEVRQWLLEEIESMHLAARLKLFERTMELC